MDQDQVARVGGDEFAVLVAGGDAERMKKFESEFAIALAEQGASDEGPVIDLSASIGTAVFPQDGRTLDDLMQVADARMYDSKAALPPRLPTPGTSGGRTLSDAPDREASRIEAFMTGGTSAASIAWLLSAVLIAAAASESSTDADAAAQPDEDVEAAEPETAEPEAVETAREDETADVRTEDEAAPDDEAADEDQGDDEAEVADGAAAAAEDEADEARPEAEHTEAGGQSEAADSEER